MPTEHTVVQGDHIAKLAHQYGFTDWKTIWNHGGNSQLRSLRKNPNVLYPGDIVHIPDREARVEQKSTDKKHRFQILREPLKLRIKVQDMNGNPVTATKCELTVDTQTYTLTSDGQGMIEQIISPAAQTGRLVVKNPSIPIDLDVPLSVGHLDPIEEREGQQARLINLGYMPGEVGTTDAFRFSQAVQEFQRNNDLTVDGVCGPNTQAKLKSLHGC